MQQTGQPSDPDSLRAVFEHLEPLLSDRGDVILAYATLARLTASELYVVLSKEGKG